jgi:hypothetical protein
LIDQAIQNAKNLCPEAAFIITTGESKRLRDSQRHVTDALSACCQLLTLTHLYTGDVVVHHNSNESLIVISAQEIVDLMATHFPDAQHVNFPAIDYFAVLGNNDQSPNYYFVSANFVSDCSCSAYFGLF